MNALDLKRGELHDAPRPMRTVKATGVELLAETVLLAALIVVPGVLRARQPLKVFDAIVESIDLVVDDLVLPERAAWVVQTVGELVDEAYLRESWRAVTASLNSVSDTLELMAIGSVARSLVNEERETVSVKMCENRIHHLHLRAINPQRRIVFLGHSSSS